MTTVYSEFKEAGGVTLPHKITSMGGRYGIEISITEFTHNEEIPAEKFVLPPMIQELITKSDGAGAETEPAGETSATPAGEAEAPAN